MTEMSYFSKNFTSFHSNDFAESTKNLDSKFSINSLSDLNLLRNESKVSDFDLSDQINK